MLGCSTKVVLEDIIIIIIRWILNKENVLRGYIEITKDIYERVVTSVRTPCGETDEFPVIISLH